ncbi:MAG: NB-ARC domain-containing protein [Candidatus Promineifilaceae bacterium]|nr:NB-ARC domain-containing protein [Candidatus Promineifilaceae bacterium]
MQEFPVLRSMSSRPNNLPRQPTPLVGREAELGEIGKLLSRPDYRLLTLVAPEGMGKTRLGLQAAADQIDVFYKGVFFVSLAGVTSKDDLPAAIANALKLSLYGAEELESQLFNYLREKHLLLLLDNLEHLLDGARTVADMLVAAPQVKILATSRRRLLLHAEWTFEVGGLAVPKNESLRVAGNYSSVELFLQSARRVQPGFNPTADEVAHDLELLATKMRDIPARQRSVQAIFEHAWKDLSPEEQRAFEGLSVFRGGFKRDAAQEVSGANLRILSELINKSLLTRDESGRFHVHELLRQFAEAKLNAVKENKAESQRRHAVFFARGTLRSLLGFGRAVFGTGDYSLSEEYLREALVLAGESNLPRAALSTAVALAATLVEEGAIEKGVALLILAADHPLADQYTKDEASGMLKELQTGMSPTEYIRLIDQARTLSLQTILAENNGAA